MNDLPSSWRISTLGEIAARDGRGLVDGPFGSNLPASSYVSEGIPVIRGSNLSLGVSRFVDDEFVYVSDDTAHKLERSLCKADDIIFTKKGTLGQTAIVPRGHEYEVFLLSSNQMKLTVDAEQADALYIYYYVSSPGSLDKLLRDAEATGVPKTNLAYLRTFPVPLPPLAEQRAIAHILGSLDDKIELNRRMNATLEATARALFQSWFVDFDPVHARAALFPDSFEESELGLIPKGWRVGRLSDVVEINPTRRLKSGERAPYLAMDNMPTQSARAIDWFHRETGSGTKFINGDVLFARITPCLENGKTAYVDFLEDGQVGWGSTEYIVFRSKPCLPLEYAYFLGRTDELREFAIRNMSGTSGRQRVSANAFEHYSLVVPSPSISYAFGEVARAVFVRMKAADEESRTLAETRDALLPKLVSGEVRVPHP